VRTTLNPSSLDDHLRVGGPSAPLLVWPQAVTASSARSRPAPANTAPPAEIRQLTSGPATYRGGIGAGGALADTWSYGAQ